MNRETPQSAFLLPVMSLWRREVVRFLRQRSRIVGALGTPIVFWLLIGSGLGHSFRSGEGGGDYLQFAFPGTLVLIVLFTAVFSMISIIEDRKEGFLQGVLAAPVGRSAIVLGKVLGASTLAIVQATLFLLVAPLVGVSLSASGLVAAVAVLMVVSVALSTLGFVMAWSMDSTQGFHAIMNLLLMPMWLLSGAFFPASGASGWIRVLMTINPLTYGVASLRHAMYWGADDLAVGGPSWGLSFTITILSTMGLIALASRIARR